MEKEKDELKKSDRLFNKGWNMEKFRSRLKSVQKIKIESPEALSKERSELAQRVTQIKLNAAKKLYQFGAALTINEEKLLDQIIGDADRVNVALGITQTRLNNFMTIMEEKRLSLRDAGGFKAYGGSPAERTVKGRKMPNAGNLGGTARYASD